MRHVRTSNSVLLRCFAIALSLVVACGGGADDPESTPCERMRDHLVDLRLETVTQDRAAHREALRHALGSELVETCQHSMSDGEVACILGAHDSAEAAACAPASK